MTRAMIERWTASEKGSPQLTLPGAQPREVQLASFDRHAPATDAWLGRFLDRDLLRVEEEATPEGFRKRSA
jgi:hypothetical protein